VVRAINKGKLHTPKYHRVNRPIRLTEADIERLLALKERMKAQDDDWMFPNRIKKGKTMKPGPIWHETLLARGIQPVADELGLPHVTWRLLRHCGATQCLRSVFRSRQRRNALVIRVPTFFLSFTLRFSTRPRRGGRVVERAVER
jgi:hypothetical protein